MKTRQIGNTDMHITPIGFGSWATGGGNWSFGWGPQDDQESIAAIQYALDLGINWIDTAAAYGLGHSEEIVGRAVHGRPERPYIFTKVGRPWNEQRKITPTLKASSIRQECENSLRRLQIDVIDLYQIHWPVPDIDLEEAWTTLAQLKDEGKVRWIGLSNCKVEHMRRVQKIAPISSVQPPYSLIMPQTEDEILPFCQEHDIGVIVYSPMMSGLLTGTMTRERVAQLPENDWRRNNDQFQESRLSRNLALAEKLAELGYRHGVSAGVVAIAWTLRHPAVTGAIVGARRPAQVDGVLPAAEFRLNDLEMAEIDKFLEEHP